MPDPNQTQMILNALAGGVSPTTSDFTVQNSSLGQPQMPVVPMPQSQQMAMASSPGVDPNSAFNQPYGSQQNQMMNQMMASAPQMNYAAMLNGPPAVTPTPWAPTL